jgi:peroxiredoxin
VDFAEALFKPGGTKLMRSLDGGYVADIIEAAQRMTHKRVVLFSRSYGAIPVLRGAHRWQTRHRGDHDLIGAILVSPDLYAEVPALGREPRYLPIAEATSIPVMIFQAEKRGNRWQLMNLVSALERGGSAVHMKMMKGVTGLFYHGDESPQAQQWLQQLPGQIPRYIRLLARYPAPLPPALAGEDTTPARRLDSELRPFAGDPQPPSIDLYDVKGRHYQRHDYTGKVTIVNFWASWCPPCVEEIPSLNRLSEQMADQPFELISINYAQDKAHIRQFLDRVDVEFPVLLDSDGTVARQWNVIAFPSTFVIGPDGRIHYGVNAAIHWDSPEVIDTLRKLAGQSQQP